VAALRGLLRRRRQGTVSLLRERLDRFRDLVEKNNQVLELIAESGEMLGGEFVFDSQYMRTLAREVRTACQAVVDDLNAITDGRYPELVETLNRIAAEVDAILESRIIVAPTDLVIPLKRMDDPMVDTVGAKMARLGAIRRRLGLRVPDGFGVTTYACQVFLQDNGIIDEMEALFSSAGPISGEVLAERSARLQKRVREARLPRELAREIDRGVRSICRHTGCKTVAVRSSALGEDGELSFAGQFRTVLGVPPGGVHDAYREVIASMYSTAVMSYRLQRGLHPARGLMGVGCLCMVPARAGGVMYTLDPLDPRQEVVQVTVVRGLGKPVVEGSARADRFALSRARPHSVLQREVAVKKEMLAVSSSGRVETVALGASEGEAPAVSEEELTRLAELGLTLERYMKCAVDIEWAIDASGQITILQARPLRISKPAARRRDLEEVISRHPVLMKGQGAVACSGVASGQVVVVEDVASLEVHDGAVLVARTSTPRLSAAVPHASAVITDVGTTTSHLATIAREFRVPTIVDAGDATEVLAGVDLVTVDADSNVVYAGRVDALLHRHLMRSSNFEDTNEFRMLRRMLRSVAPLNLRDPQSREFSAAGCSTYHDIIRFAHEKAVQELAEGDWLEPSQRARFVYRLDLALPLDLVLVDLGGGLTEDCVGRKRVKTANIASLPLHALIEGLTAPGVWATDPTTMDPNAFMASATRAAPWLTTVTSRPQNNLAIISQQYLNLNLRLGFHFNIVDCFVGETRNDNYIYFRFAGGVTELRRRARRADLLRRILEGHDFVVESRGDLVTARIKKISKGALLSRMQMIGRLIGYTRQLDILLGSEETVDVYVERFLDGRFGVGEGKEAVPTEGRSG
jgi:pyruvate,water dikinase